MKAKYKNIFFLLGLLLLSLMAWQLDYPLVLQRLDEAGLWFALTLALWALLYVQNTLSWWIIIKSEDTLQDTRSRSVSFLWLYKVTVSAFALNYATPGGLMGGEPYRIMELSPKIGVERASSSVLLFVMTHIFSHFWFWLLCSLVFLFCERLTVGVVLLLVPVVVVSLLAIWFFLKGYRRGIAVRLMGLAGRIWGLRKRVAKFVETHEKQLSDIDLQIASLHSQSPRTFVLVVAIELFARFLSALEVLFLLFVLSPEATYLQALYIIAFTTLIANIFFFMPLQLGGREGGFLMSIKALQMTASTAGFVALLVRVRELLWTALGLLLIKKK